MSKKMNKILSSKAFGALLYRFIRLYASTFRLTIINEQDWMEHMENGGRVLLCTWHQQFFSVIRHFKKYAPCHPAIMISKSADGQLIAGVAARTGWIPVRGSSSRGGREALSVMIETLKHNRMAGHIVDGPRGPAGIVKPGIIRLANATGAMVVPFYLKADRAWFFRSWDRFMLPKPFAKVTLTFGAMMRFDPPAGEGEFEQQRLHLENVMRPWLHA